MLVVDDSMIVRRLICDAAAKAGWQVLAEASNGQEAIDRYRETHPDLVTLDLIMPDYDGMHALKGILEADPEARVIVVSALEQKGVLKDAFRAGASDFVLKPFNHAALVDTLQQIFQTAG
jgi:two-component system chemotaxis response regulator CheY